MNKRAPNEFETHAMKSRLNIILIAVYGKKQPETLISSIFSDPSLSAFQVAEETPNVSTTVGGRANARRAATTLQHIKQNAQHSETSAFLRHQGIYEPNIVQQCKYRSPQKCTRAKTETDRIFVVQT